MMMRKAFNILVIVLLLPLQVLATEALAAVVCNDSVARARAFDYYYIQAISLREAEKYDEAFDLLEHCLALQPSSAIVQYELYSMYSFLGRNDEAIRMIENASACEPDNYWYRSMLAAAYEENGNHDKARQVYEAMAKDFSSHSELYYILYQIYAGDKEYDKAIGALDNVERIEGKNEQLTLQKCRIYTLMQEHGLVIDEMQELVNEYPDEPRMRIYMASAYEMIGETDKALDIYRDVLAEDPGNVAAQASLADFYSNEGNDSLYTGMVEMMLMNERFVGEERNRLLVRHISWKELTDSTGYNFRLLDKLMEMPHEKVATAEIYVDYLRIKNASNDSVAPMLERLLQLEPENQKAQLGLLQIAIDREDYSEVIMRCDTAILYNPELVELHYYKGISCYQEGRMSEAVESLKKVVGNRDEHLSDEFISNVFSILGDIYHELGSWDSCVQAYDSALVYNSSNVGALNNYAYYLSMEGVKLDKAEEMSLATIKAEPENPTYIDTYMWILFCKERYQEARAYAEKLLAIEELNADKVLLHHCGDIYAKCGDMDSAVELWKRAQAAGDDSRLLDKKIRKRKYYADKKKKK